jgi:7-cyano-7-deazaguanine synthase
MSPDDTVSTPVRPPLPARPASAARALVLFSGGQDSTTCLAWALEHTAHVETLGIDYGQRHRIELDCRAPLLAALRAQRPDWAGRLGDDHLLDLRVLGQISDTALTRERAIAFQANGLPDSFVPARNLIFLSFAAAVAYRRGLDLIVGGMCQTDYSGYPDCRDATLKAMQLALQLGLDTRLELATPLMWLDKAQTWALAHTLGGEALTRLIVEDTHTCYHGDRTTRHDWGYGCGRCPACELRARGHAQFRAAEAGQRAGRPEAR